MTVIARDTFTGGDDSDISGRTPDGGGSGPLAVGTYGVAYRVDGADHLDISSGKLVAPSGVFDTLLYALSSSGVASPDYEVRLTVDLALVTDGFANAYVGLRVDESTGDGYWLELVAIDGLFYVLTLFSVAGGTFTQLDQVTSDDPLSAGAHVLTIRATDDAISGDIDGLASVAGTDATYTAAGNPGLGGFNGDAAVEFRATLFEVDDEPSGGGGPPDPCTYLASRHEFYDPARADVDGQPTDTYPGLGTLTKHPASVAAIAEAGSQGWILGTGRAVYLDSGIEGQVAGDPVVLGDDYCADAVVKFPRVPSTNPIGDPPGCIGNPWVEVWRYRVTVDATITEAGLVSDLLGFDGDMATGFLTFRDLEVWPSGQPKRFTGGVNPTGAAEAAIEFYTTLHPLVEGEVLYRFTLEWAQLVDPEVVDPPGPDTYSFSQHAFSWTIGGNVREFGIGPDTRSYPPFSYYTQNPSPSTWDFDVAGTVAMSFRFSSGGSTDVGEADVSLSEVKYNNLLSFVTCIPPSDPGDEVDGEGEHAAAEVLVRYDQAADSGYGFRLEFLHVDQEIIGTATLFKRTAGSESSLFAGGVTLEHDTLYQPRLRVAGTTLVAELDGIPLASVDDADFATGDPGLGGFDETESDPALLFEQFSVYNPDTEIQPPCIPEGGGDPPGTTDPPPGPLQLGYWERRNLRWRFVPLPTAEFPTSGTLAQRNLLARPVSTLTGVPPDAFGARRNLAWRFPTPQTGEGDPPSVSPYPPGFDPCELTPPTDTPPDVTIGAPPDLLFFAWHITATQLGPLWTATYMGMGPAILTGISQAAARSSAVFGTPGDKRKFFRNGRYASDLMDAWIYSLAPISAAVLAAQTAGSFAGVHAADDWENPALWPPFGLPLTEVNRIGGVWKTVFPGLRVMLRARTGQIGGTSMPNIDGIISQMRMTGAEWEAAGRTAAGYARGELDFCQDRGWILHLSQNVYNGTQVRVPMTAAQVLDNGRQWVDVVGSHAHGGAVYGMGIWQFFPSGGYDATGPDYLNAYAAWRNAMIPLGPPTFP